MASAKIDGRLQVASSCTPFQLLVGDTLAYGDDWCNAYHATYQQRSDSIVVNAVFRTAVYCGGAHFDAFQLSGPWQVLFSNGSLTLAKQSLILEFSSLYAMPICTYPFVDKSLKVQYSDDTSFSRLKALDLLPILTLGTDRLFTLEWYFAPRNPFFKSNPFAGAFGIGASRSISFYHNASQYAEPDSLASTIDASFVNQIWQSTTFSYSSKCPTLPNSSSWFFLCLFLLKNNSCAA